MEAAVCVLQIQEQSFDVKQAYLGGSIYGSPSEASAKTYENKEESWHNSLLISLPPPGFSSIVFFQAHHEEQVDPAPSSMGCQIQGG